MGSKQTLTMGTAQHGTTNYWDGKWNVCLALSSFLGGMSTNTLMDCWAPRYLFAVSTSPHVSKYTQVPSVEKAPVLMLRPRAWNMTEHNVLLGLLVLTPAIRFDTMIHAFRWTRDFRSLSGFWTPDVSCSSSSPCPRKWSFLLPLQAGGEHRGSTLEPHLHLEPGGAWIAKRDNPGLRPYRKCLCCL